jgi:hypothetical protein
MLPVLSLTAFALRRLPGRACSRSVAVPLIRAEGGGLSMPLRGHQVAAGSLRTG